MQADQTQTASVGVRLRRLAALAQWHGVERGQGLVEYALVILLVALAVVAALSLLAPTINSIFRAIPPAL